MDDSGCLVVLRWSDEGSGMEIGCSKGAWMMVGCVNKISKQTQAERSEAFRNRLGSNVATWDGDTLTWYVKASLSVCLFDSQMQACQCCLAQNRL